MLIGAAALWWYTSGEGRQAVRQTATRLDSATRPAREDLRQRMEGLKLQPDDIKEELARSGQVVRRKAQETGRAIADATSDARITAAIKGRLLAHPELSALSISVNTTDGVVTLAGAVSSREQISQAMLLAMETDGVREVISTLQVREPREGKG